MALTTPVCCAMPRRCVQFMTVTVPAVIEQQSGAVTRKLQKANETFDIENAKVMKREQKVVKRFEAHVGKTAQDLEDEKVTSFVHVIISHMCSINFLASVMVMVLLSLSNRHKCVAADDEV
jgi:hypothetical protein